MERYKKLTLLHSNDMHGDFLAEKIDEKLVGGVSMLSGYVKKVREEEPNTLYCIAGDMFRGSVIDSEYQGLSTIEIMNMLAPDIVTIGNHETDYGLAHLLFIEKCANFPIINANLHIKMNGSRLFKPYEIIEIDGMKILFIGILTEEVMSQTKKEGIISSFIDVVDAAKEIGKICNAFNAIDIDFTVLLTHIGFEEDKHLAEHLDPSWGVDVIIGGHSHTLMDEPFVVNGIPIVQAGTGTDQIGRFDIIVDTDTNSIASYNWSIIPINDKNCIRDLKIEDYIKSIKEKTDLKYERIICRFNKKYEHADRKRQTELGSIISDVLREALGVNLMLVTSGAIRKQEAGPIFTYKDLIEVIAYDEPLYQIILNGKQIKELVCYICRDDGLYGKHTEFYQFSKEFKITYSKSKHNVIIFKYNDRDIFDEQLFTVCIARFDYINFKENFGIDLKEIEKNQKARKVSTSIQDVLDENMSEKKPKLDPNFKERLLVID